MHARSGGGLQPCSCPECVSYNCVIPGGGGGRSLLQSPFPLLCCLKWSSVSAQIMSWSCADVVDARLALLLADPLIEDAGPWLPRDQGANQIIRRLRLPSWVYPVEVLHHSLVVCAMVRNSAHNCDCTRKHDFRPMARPMAIGQPKIGK